MIIEYTESLTNTTEAELHISSVGIALNENNVGDLKKEEGNRIQAKIPKPALWKNNTDFQWVAYCNRYVRKGRNVFCDLFPNNAIDSALEKMTRAYCTFIVCWDIDNEGHYVWDSKPAVLLGSSDPSDCTPYIATAGHVSFALHDLRMDNDYNVIRFNGNLRNTCWTDSTKYNYEGNEDYWDSTKDFSKIIDYAGTELLVKFPIKNGKIGDIGFLKLNQPLIHNAWMSGWDVRCISNGSAGYLDTAHFFTDFGGLYHAKFKMDDLTNCYDNFPGEFYNDYPWFTRVQSGYSGSPAFRRTTNNIYRYIGPLAWGGTADEVCISKASFYIANFNLGFDSTNNPLNEYGKYLRRFDDSTTRFYDGREYSYNQCFAGHSCCEYFDMKVKNRIINTTGDTCTSEITINESFDNFKKDCSDGTLVKITDLTTETVLYDSVEVNFDSNGKMDTIKKTIGIKLQGSSTYEIHQYLIEFYDNNGLIYSCSKELLFSCHKTCHLCDNGDIDTSLYDIQLSPEDSSGSECCYKIIISKKFNDTSACVVRGIFAAALKKNVFNEWDTRNERYYYEPESYKYDSIAINFPDTLHNLCLESDELAFHIYMFEDFQKNTVFNEDNLERMPLFRDWPENILGCSIIKPVQSKCNCCDNITITSITSGNCDPAKFKIKINDYPNCQISKIVYETYLYDKYNLRDSILIYKDSMAISPSDSFNINLKKEKFDNNTNSVYYKIHFFDASGNEICSKDIAQSEMNNCNVCSFINFNPPQKDANNVCCSIYTFNAEYDSRLIIRHGTITDADTTLAQGQAFTIKLCPLENSTYTIIYKDVTNNDSCKFQLYLNCYACRQLGSLNVNKTSDCCYKITVPYPSYANSLSYCQVKGTSAKYYVDSTNNFTINNLCNNGKTVQYYTLDFKNNSDTSKILCSETFKLDPCVSNCCEDAQIELLYNFGNSTHEEPSEVCCYKLNIKNVSCPVTSIVIYQTGKTYAVDSIANSNGTPIEDLEHYSVMMENWICQTPGKPQPDTIRVVLKDHYGDTCVKTVVLPVCNNSCCNNLGVNVNPVPYRDDGFECCYEVSFYIENSKCLKLKTVEITSNGNPIWKSPDFYIETGYQSEYICVPSYMQNGLPLPLSIKFTNSSGMVMCEKLAVVQPCLKPVTVPCKPDAPAIDWVINSDSTYPSKTLRFKCPNDTNLTCDVQFTYTYRYLQTPDTLRDIQPLSYTVNGNCVCQEEIRRQILLAILNDPQVKVKFRLDTNNFNPGEIRCYDNFRLVTGDCWDSTYYPPSWGGMFYDGYGSYSKRRCDDTVCCYEKYHVCYKKNPDQTVTVLENSIIGLSGYYYPQQCESNDSAHCIPDNCKNWYLGPPIAIMDPNDVEDTGNSEECKISLIQNLNEELLNVGINCYENGKVKLEIINLLGHLVLHYDYEKNNQYFSQRIVLNLTTGMYLCNVSLNNKIFAFKQIFVIK